jgi:ribosomal protein S18 acetylase RimI-like enzyme
MHEHRLDSGKRYRSGPWKGRAEVAMVTTFSDFPLTGGDVEALVARLHAQGVARILTAALTPEEATGFEAAGFVVDRTLALLQRPIDEPIPAPAVPLKRWRRRSLAPILEIDNAAFDEFWAFDEVAMRDAMSATPHRVLKVNRDQPLEAYALTGLAGSRGYLQRLAVSPRATGRGLGRALVSDSLRWMRWHGATEAFVNTQTDNDRALDLYRRMGFEPESEGLVIMAYDLEAGDG